MTAALGTSPKNLSSPLPATAEGGRQRGAFPVPSNLANYPDRNLFSSHEAAVTCSSAIVVDFFGALAEI